MSAPLANLHRSNIRRRTHRVSLDAARSFLMRQRQSPPLEQWADATQEPECAETPSPEKTELLSVEPHLSNVREIDRHWGRLLDALESGTISPGEGRQLARDLGRIRQNLVKIQSRADYEKVAFYK
ncbi:MAG: hypothetical protein HW380_1025 [Magnetococcales bacterium]|nr:hypothetical protein [Magnetococcales bacterium]HIJ85723.1 hypothetical protein [Magnetococcales bacterium]